MNHSDLGSRLPVKIDVKCPICGYQFDTARKWAYCLGCKNTFLSKTYEQPMTTIPQNKQQSHDPVNDPVNHPKQSMITQQPPPASDTSIQQEQVKEFMRVFGQETPDKPTIPSLKIRKLRAKLILEEALEEIDALGLCVEGQCDIVESNIEPDLVLIADGLADSHYVGYLGTAIACGINNMDEIFDEVHRSNMAKLWTDKEVRSSKMPGYMFK